jgi:peroxiredoxin Q/BCP
MRAADVQGPLAVGSLAPDFELDSTGGGSVRLSALLAEGPVALYFYPGDFTPG